MRTTHLEKSTSKIKIKTSDTNQISLSEYTARKNFEQRKLIKHSNSTVKAVALLQQKKNQIEN
ncbi:MAG: hypothetical protein K9W44_11240 [Candidatus Lokiarchaeota archaeon]|nr:hypothetical protein [Candidatus Harpocratesius repetitus]